MNHNADQNMTELIDRAMAGDNESLETLIAGVQDLVFNLSLRMLGTFPDAEDAAQDILLKVITHLSSFKRDSLFSTWVFRIATNHLINYKKHMFAHASLTFEYYGDDIEHAPVMDIPDLTQNVDRELLAEELKMSCTNVMLQCLDPESRCIFVLGTMFRLDSRVAGEILGLTPEAYRKRLSRIRRKMADFLTEYCGEYGNGRCRCANRLNYAIQSHRLNPGSLDYTSQAVGSGETVNPEEADIPREAKMDFIRAMDEIDELSSHFTFCRMYRSPERTRQFFRNFLESPALAVVKNT